MDLKPGDKIRVGKMVGILARILNNTVWYHEGATGAYKSAPLSEVKPA